MPVKVRVYATLIDMVGARVKEVSYGGGTVGGLLKEAGLYDILVDNGRVKAMYKVLVNGRDIDFLEGLDTRVEDGDIVDVFPPVAGG